MTNIFYPNPRMRIYTDLGMFVRLFLQAPFSQNEAEWRERLEHSICYRFGVSGAVCMPQARVGLYMALKEIIKPGQDVIMSPYTIADVVNMVICAGGHPVFADIDSKTCNIRPDEVEALITKQTGAVIITHLHGLACELENISAICSAYNVPLIEDTAQAFGGIYKGRRLGAIGDIGIYSFGMYKNITSFYGGMVVGSDSLLIERIRQRMSSCDTVKLSHIYKKALHGLATHIVTSKPLFQLLVYKIFRHAHLNNITVINKYVQTELDLSLKEKIPEKYLRNLHGIQAKLVLDRIDRVDTNSEIRVEYAKIYNEKLSGLDQLILPPLKTNGEHIYGYYPIQFHDRGKLIRWIIKNGSDVAKQHIKNCADLPAFKAYYRDCPQARTTAKNCILLPSYPGYGEHNVLRLVDNIKSFFDAER